MLALGACALAPLLAPAAALAQCNPGDGAPPPPPTAGITASFSNQSFGTPPRTPYSIVSPTQPGCTGPTGFAGNSGGTGGAGQASGPVTSTNTNVTIISGTGSVFYTIGALISGSGSNGGTGGLSGIPTN